MEQIQWRNKIRAAFSYIMFPDIPKCMACGSEEIAEKALRLCRRCMEKFREMECDPALGEMKGYLYIAAYRYEGIVRDCIHDMKYNGREWYADYFAAAMVEILEGENIGFDEITYVPMMKKKEKRRGYNQARSIALAIGEKTGKPCVCCLKRIKQEKSQTKLTAKQRRENIKGAFTPLELDLTRKRVLLVDDVMTTGSTAMECAGILKKMGAERVHIAVFAKT